MPRAQLGKIHEKKTPGKLSHQSASVIKKKLPNRGRKWSVVCVGVEGPRDWPVITAGGGGLLAERSCWRRAIWCKLQLSAGAASAAASCCCTTRGGLLLDEEEADESGGDATATTPFSPNERIDGVGRRTSVFCLLQLRACLGERQLAVPVPPPLLQRYTILCSPLCHHSAKEARARIRLRRPSPHLHTCAVRRV